jgi:hypothetical protein
MEPVDVDAPDSDVEALFSRQTAKGTAPKTTSQDAPGSPARGKRKRESSLPVDEVEEKKPATGPSRSVKTEPVDVDASDSDVEILPGRPSPVRVFYSHHSHFISHAPQSDPPSQSKKGKGNSSPSRRIPTRVSPQSPGAPSLPRPLTYSTFFSLFQSLLPPPPKRRQRPRRRESSRWCVFPTGVLMVPHSHYRNCLAYHAVLAPQETGEIRARQVDAQNHIVLFQNLKASPPSIASQSSCYLSLYVMNPSLYCMCNTNSKPLLSCITGASPHVIN